MPFTESCTTLWARDGQEGERATCWKSTVLAVDEGHETVCVEMCENGPFHHDALDSDMGDGHAEHTGRLCPILSAPIPSGWVWQFLSTGPRT